MNEKVLVFAPHADDETLGCGGTILRHKSSGDFVHWAIVTDIFEENMLFATDADERKKEILELQSKLDLDDVHQLGFATTKLNEIPFSDVINAISTVIKKIKPNYVYIPFYGDIHSDHSIVFRAVASCTKWFRNSSIRHVRVYETLSETNFSINPTQIKFHPNLYIDISDYLSQKIDALSVFKNEIGKHPFPRSKEAVKALATLRGSEAGVLAAESFMIIKQIEF